MRTRPSLSLLAAALVLAPTSAYAVEYDGRVTAGVYQSKETLAEPSAGSQTNDSWAYLARAFLDLTAIGPYHNEFVVDVHDRYDYFGQVDRERLVLSDANEPELRQLAVKYPYEGDDLYWSLGRFPIAHAGVLALDGAELGYGLTNTWRLGLFGGLVPASKKYNETDKPDPDDREVGLYSVYETKNQDWFHHTYFANSFIVEQASLTPETLEGLTGDDTTNVLTSGAATETPATKTSTTSVRWYTNLIYQSGQGSRLTALSYLYLTPKAYLRNFWLAYYRELTRTLTSTVSLTHLDLTEYDKVKDIRETIAPSAYEQGKGELKQKIGRRVEMKYEALYGKRTADGLNKWQVAAGPVVSQVFRSHVEASLRLGYRKNFLSHDDFAKVGVMYYARSFDIGVTEQAVIERHDDGRTLHPMFSELSFDGLVGQNILAGVALEYAKDENATVTSGLLTLGYRINSKQMTPVRDQAPPLDRL